MGIDFIYLGSGTNVNIPFAFEKAFFTGGSRLFMAL